MNKPIPGSDAASDDVSSREHLTVKPNTGGVIDLLNAVHRSHLRLNVMADQKANILMGIIGIMFTVVLTKLMSSESYSVHLQLILIVFIALELIAFSASLMVIAPKFHGRFAIKNIEAMPNPFFFGFYTNFKEEDYVAHMLGSIDDNEKAKALFLKDIYQMGKILKRKYKQLRRAYLFAFLGVAISLVLFILDVVVNLIRGV
ncbi:MAG: hypothetical protein COA68_09720 [Oceanobacter sp.]|nr:MAG: hypothetical protein COA68_09720 [Oceanobacter sp.]